MVIERVVKLYVCELCKMEYSTREKAVTCENNCRGLTGSPGLNQLKLSPRAFNALYSAGLMTVQELEQLTDQELLKIRNIGKRSFLEVKDKLQQYQAQNK